MGVAIDSMYNHQTPAMVLVWYILKGVANAIAVEVAIGVLKVSSGIDLQSLLEK